MGITGLIGNPNGAYGYSPEIEAVSQEFQAATAITAGDAVVLNASSQVTTTTTAQSASVIGIALENAIAGASVRVCTLGVCTAIGNGAIAAGVLLSSSATAGQVETPATATVGTNIGFSITACAALGDSFQVYVAKM